MCLVVPGSLVARALAFGPLSLRLAFGTGGMLVVICVLRGTGQPEIRRVRAAIGTSCAPAGCLKRGANTTEVHHG